MLKHHWRTVVYMYTRERDMHEGHVTSSTMRDALDRGLKKDRGLADPCLRFPHLAIAKRPSPLGGGASDSDAPTAPVY